jgi:hypothetical protein
LDVVFLFRNITLKDIKMKEFILIAFMCLFSSHVISEEIVMNKEGQPVLLKDDHTWELVDTSGDDDKVVFRIIDGVDSQASYARKDDFDKITHYDNYVGCKYNIEIENRTEHKIKVGHFMLTQNDKKMFPRGHMAYALYQFRKVIEPGQKFAKSDDSLTARTDLKTKEPPTNAEIEMLIERYGCKAQSGKIFIRSGFGETKPFIIFSSESDIVDAAVRSFVKTSQTGMYPLQEKIGC